MKILGISGKRGVGKTALANYLARHRGFIVVSFAKPLRELAKSLFPFSEFDFVSPARKEKPFSGYPWSPREFLIHLGEFMRYHDEAYWVKKGVESCSDPEQRYVFDDVRYPNEAEAIKAVGGKILRINRYEKNNPYGKDLDIPSESSMDKYAFDYTIQDCANTTLSQLHNEGENVFKELKW